MKLRTIGLALMSFLLAAVFLTGTPAPVQASCLGCLHSFCNTCLQSHARCELYQPQCQCFCVPNG